MLTTVFKCPTAIEWNYIPSMNPTNYNGSLSSLSPDEILSSGVDESLHDDLVLRQEEHGALELPSA